MSRIVDCIRRARKNGELPEHFRTADVRNACPCRAKNTYGTFLPKHRVDKVDKPGHYTKKYFKRHAPGLYSLIEEIE